VTLTFDNLADGTSVGVAYPGVSFQNATVLTSGISLDEFEFPPYSGTNVVFDDGGPLLVQFDVPVTAVSLFLTHVQNITLSAFDSSGIFIDAVFSIYYNNLALSGDPGSSPNELLTLSAPSITSVLIEGSPGGSSFTADDLTFTTSTTVPEVSSLCLSLAGLAAFVAIRICRRKRRLRPAILPLLLGFVSIMRAAPTLGPAAVLPSQIPAGVASTLLFTVSITDPSVIPNGVNLLRVDSTGQTLNIVGQLHDDGQSGDAKSGDQIYSIAINTTENSAGQVYFRISAAFRGVLQRVQSPVMTVSVVSSTLPPDPKTVAPPLVQTGATPLGQAVRFLYDGPNPIQTGVDQTKLVSWRAGVIRGRVLDGSANPLPGVRISINDHPELGQTLSRADGWFDMAINAGGVVVVNYDKAGYLPAQRSVPIDWLSWKVVRDVILVQPDASANAIDLTSQAVFQIAKGSVVKDDDGTRQAMLLFPYGTSASLVLPNGTTSGIQNMTVRITEFTVGLNGSLAMPANLPPSSQYTYAAEYSVDEAIAAGAQTVTFSQPVINYLDNFLQFPVGTPIPVGHYDRNQGRWLGEPDGRVVQVLDVVGGLAALDVDGQGQPSTAQERAALGITWEELRQIGALYNPGAQFWRTTMTHFSVDLNSPPGIGPAGAVAPCCSPTLASAPTDNPCIVSGSILDCHNQVLGEAVPVVGTPWRLHYVSSRQKGRKVAANTLFMQLTDDKLPAAVKGISVTVAIAGREIDYCFQPSKNLSTTFTWDGLDAYGRPMVGSQKVNVDIEYLYPVLGYGSTRFGSGGGGSGGTITFGEFSAMPGAVIGHPKESAVNQCGRQFNPPFGLGLGIVKKWSGVLNGGDARGNSIAGWSISAQNFYDVTGQVMLNGDGTRRGVQSPQSQNKITQSIANGECHCRDVSYDPGAGDGGPVSKATIIATFLAVAPDGSYYMGNSRRIRKVAADGNVTTVIGDGVFSTAPPTPSQSGDGGPASAAKLATAKDMVVGPNGDLFILDDQRIRRIGTDGIVRAFAGTGVAGYAGDDGPALNAQFWNPTKIAAGSDGSVYVADSLNQRIRQITPFGVIRSIAGTGKDPTQVIDSQPSIGQAIYAPQAIAVGPNGDIVFTEYHGRIRKITPEGLLVRVAGTTTGYSGDDGPALQAQLGGGHSLAINARGEIFFDDADLNNGTYALREIDLDGIIRRVAGSQSFATFNAYPLNLPGLQYVFLGGDSMSFAPDGSLYMIAGGQWYVRLSGPFEGLHPGEVAVGSEDGAQVDVFDEYGQQSRTLNPWTGAVELTFAYDSNRRLTAITDAYGNATQIERDAAGNPTAIVSPYGRRTTLSVGSDGMLSSVINPAGETTRFSYIDGLMTEMIDPRNGRHQMQYETDGRLKFDADPASGSKTLQGTGAPLNMTVAATTAMGRTTTYSSDRTISSDEKQVLTDSAGFKTSTEYLGSGQVTIAPPDKSTVSASNSADPRWSMGSPYVGHYQLKTPGGLSYLEDNIRSVTLNDPNDPFSLSSWQQVKTKNSKTSISRFDSFNRTFTFQSARSRRSTAVLDANGRLSQNQFASFLPVNYTYDVRGRLRTVSQGTGTDQRTVTFDYNPAGLVSAVTDPLGQTTSFTYDLAGRVKTQTMPGARTVTFDYDANGNLTSLTPPGKSAHTFTYDPVDLATSYVAPAVPSGGTNTSVASYNPDHQMSSVLRPDGQTSTFGFDSAGRVAGLTYPGDQLTAKYSTTTGQLTDLNSTSGVSLSFGFDGPIPTSTTWTGAVHGSAQVAFNNNLLPSSISVNSAGPISYAYDDDNLVTAAGDLTITRDQPTGFVTGTSIGAITDAYTYNSFGEVATYTVSNGSTTLFSESFTYDKLGRIATKNETVNGSSTAFAYDYDVAERLWRVHQNGTLINEYIYDANGNRLTVNGAPTGTYDAQDRLAQYGSNSYGYTAAGELKSRTGGGQTTLYDYDAAGSLRHVTLPNGTVIEYVIDSLGRRVGKKINGILVKGWLYQDILRPVAETDGSGNVVTRFIYANSSNVPVYLIKGGVTFRLITDQVGSIRLVVNATTSAILQQIDYDAFGQVLSDSNPGVQPFGFAGGIYDPDTKLVRFGARDYDAWVGRWTVQDPIRFHSHTTNLYQYVRNNPLNRIDTTGLDDADAGCFGDKQPPEPKEKKEEPSYWEDFKEDLRDLLKDLGIDVAAHKIEDVPLRLEEGDRPINATNERSQLENNTPGFMEKLGDLLHTFENKFNTITQQLSPGSTQQDSTSGNEQPRGLPTYVPPNGHEL
jgi:RHS repeat-associated protein